MAQSWRASPGRFAYDGPMRFLLSLALAAGLGLLFLAGLVSGAYWAVAIPVALAANADLDSLEPRFAVEAHLAACAGCAVNR